jgi:RHS repeat-associated protein
MTSSLTNGVSVSYTDNHDDELVSESYDQDGNVIASGGKTFAYDTENHLVSMNSGAVTIVYDGDDNRVKKIVGGVTTQYLVDDLNPTGYPQVVEELTNGAVSRTYTYGLQRISQNQVISNTWTPSFYGYDGLGTVRQLTNSSGTITDTYDYDAFGNKINSTGTTPNAYLYRGEQWDTDLGIYYLRARYYNPTTGRFMSRDPDDGSPYDPETLHKYAYANADPVDGFDPSGRATAGTMPGARVGGTAIGDYIVLTLQAASTIVAADTFGCAVARSYNFLAVKFKGDTDITNEENCKVKGKGRMRVQLQLGLGNGQSEMGWGRAVSRDDPPGVTVGDVGGLLFALYGAANSNQAGSFPKKYARDLGDAIIKVSLCAKSKVPGGVDSADSTTGKSVCTANVGATGWRVDLDNLAGHNLTE